MTVVQTVAGDALDLLPAGEWAEVRLLSNQPGMMAGRNWAHFARAKWLRGGGKPAFIKMIVPASPSAGRETDFVTGKARLKALSERLRKIQMLGSRVPIVPLLEIGLTDAGLMIAMEDVRPLSELIEKGQAYDFSTRVLSDLDPAGKDWMHFDICPMNVGVSGNGKCVLIDVESLYVAEGGSYKISVPAWKPFRVPEALKDAVEKKLLAGFDFDKDFAMRKVRFEVALVAAECVVGPMEPGNVLDRSVIEEWFRKSDQSDPAVAFCKAEMLQALQNADIRPLAEIKKGFELIVQGGAGMVLPPVAKEPVPEVAPVIPAAAPARSQRERPEKGSDWQREWRLLEPLGRILRAGRLDKAEISEYGRALRDVAARHPTQPEAWEELLLVVISYEKNAAVALAIVNDAYARFPGNEEFGRLRNIVEMWATERKNG